MNWTETRINFNTIEIQYQNTDTIISAPEHYDAVAFNYALLVKDIQVDDSDRFFYTK